MQSRVSCVASDWPYRLPACLPYTPASCLQQAASRLENFNVAAATLAVLYKMHATRWIIHNELKYIILILFQHFNRIAWGRGSGWSYWGLAIVVNTKYMQFPVRQPFSNTFPQVSQSVQDIPCLSMYYIRRAGLIVFHILIHPTLARPPPPKMEKQKKKMKIASHAYFLMCAHKI